MREGRLRRRAAEALLAAALALAAGCAHGATTPDAADGGDRDAILAELEQGGESELLATRIAILGDRALAALATPAGDQGARGALLLLERSAPGRAWSISDERSLGRAELGDPEALVLELDPHALALSRDEDAAAVSFGAQSDGEGGRVVRALFRVEDGGLRELLRYAESDSGAGSPHERVEHALSARPAAGRVLADLVLETHDETCTERDGEWRCEESRTTRVLRWNGETYAEGDQP